MGLLSSLRDRYILQPVAKRILQEVKPLQPLQKSQPNIFSVPIGFNQSMGANNKNQVSGGVMDWRILRSLSVNHETTRAAINTRKRQITSLAFDVVDIDDDTDPESTEDERKEIRRLVTSLGGPGVRFRELLDKLIEDTLVLDALCFYKQRTRGGQLLRIIPVDPTTIKLRVGSAGERPMPPEIAFEQWIKGKLVAEMTSKEMVYEMMNPRTNSPYGLSPLESLLLTLDSSMRALLYNLNYLSDGNVPQGFLSMPEEWTVDQIKEYKEWFDAMLSNSKATSKVFPIPAGTTYQATSKPSDFSFQEFFDYLDRKVCMMFDLQPQELGINLKQYKENADGQERITIRRGMKPLANFLQEVFTDIIQEELGMTQYQFKFAGLESRFNVEDAKTLIPLGVVGIDEMRNDMGLSKLGVKQFVITGNTITPVDQIEAAFQAAQENQKKLAERPQQAFGHSPKESPKAKKVEKRLEKIAINDALEKALSEPTAAEYREKFEGAILTAIAPFTKTRTITELTKTQKAAGGPVAERVNDAFETITIEGIDEFLKWAAKQGGEHAFDQLDIRGSFTLTNDKFEEMLGNRSVYLIESLDETTKEWLIDKIVTGKAAGKTNAEIAQEISDKSGEITRARAETIVNTEVANAMQTAELNTYREQGIEKKVWVLSEDIGDECGVNADAGEIPIDKAFPSGDDAPPLHPNCRCFLQAVVEKL